MQSSQEVRAMNKCDQPNKYCCPENSNRVTDILSKELKFPEDCGSTPMYGVNRVVGGGVIEPDEFSWLVSLEYALSGGTSAICAGAIINSLYVLTAAHCVIGNSIREMGGLKAVRFGDFSNGQKCDYGTSTCQHFQRIAIEEIIVHKDYMEDDRMRLLYDISLLRLTKRIQFTDGLKPICLPFGNNSHIVEPSADTWVTLTGWGRTSSLADPIAKRAVSIPLWTKSRCLNDTRRDESQICAGISGRGSCHGDSGGPLMHEFENKRMVLEGIMSYGGKECATFTSPGVCTRVRSFGDWIEINIRM
ncbi:CLIP domain-containing serine protease 2-like [Drosophila innubila]|uniref:CLIP domain-containing serine protease 2-like n=1 Tax=Drosophila innubila TaxID=198719 RepID=UPI00148C93B8|nr:CLIP domain-containing serine protease 2-like [Drosophila innubila]